MTALLLQTLQTMQPTQAQMQDKQFQLIVENMKYCLGNGESKHQTWLKTFIRDRVTNLDSKRKKVLDDSNVRDFYNNKLAVVYLGRIINGLEGQGAPKNRLTDEENRRLAFYLQAGMPLEPEFQLQNSQLLSDTYKQVVNIQPYIDDNKNFKWSTQLYQQFAHDRHSLAARLRLTGDDGAKAMQEFASNFTKLKVLGDDVSANLYHRRTLHAYTMSSVDQVQNTDDVWNIGLETFLSGMAHPDAKNAIGDNQTYIDFNASKEDFQASIKKMGSIAALASSISRTVAAFGSPKNTYYQKIDLACRAIQRADDRTWAQFAKETGIKAGTKMLRTLRAIGVLGAVAIPSFFLYYGFKSGEDKSSLAFIRKQSRYSLQILGGLCQAMPEYLGPAAKSTAKFFHGKIRSYLQRPEFESATIGVDVGRAGSPLTENALQEATQTLEAASNDVSNIAFRNEIVRSRATSASGEASADLTAQIETRQIGGAASVDEALQAQLLPTSRLAGNLRQIAAGDMQADLAFADSAFAKFFSASRIAVMQKWLARLGAVVAIGIAGFSVWDVVEDIKDNAAQRKRVFDGLTLATNVGFAACTVAGLFVGAEATAAAPATLAATSVPVLGTLFAVAGIVVMVVEMETAETPKSEVDKFMDDTLKKAFEPGGFIKPFDKNTKDWKIGDTIPAKHMYTPASEKKAASKAATKSKAASKSGAAKTTAKATAAMKPTAKSTKTSAPKAAAKVKSVKAKATTVAKAKAKRAVGKKKAKSAK